MSQEEHWKQAYRDKCKELDDLRKKIDQIYIDNWRSKFNEIETECRHLHARIKDREDLYNKMEETIFWVEDDIMTTLSDDARNKIWGVIDKIKKFRKSQPLTGTRT
jgi:hypothetical protein